jgi:hypothetical protein
MTILFRGPGGGLLRLPEDPDGDLMRAPTSECCCGCCEYTVTATLNDATGLTVLAITPVGGTSEVSGRWVSSGAYVGDYTASINIVDGDTCCDPTFPTFQFVYEVLCDVALDPTANGHADLEPCGQNEHDDYGPGALPVGTTSLLAVCCTDASGEAILRWFPDTSRPPAIDVELKFSWTCAAQL